MDNENEYELNLCLVDAGPASGGHATSTDDDCGSGDTDSDACSGGSGR
jgi:FxLD family lantipeptide